VQRAGFPYAFDVVEASADADESYARSARLAARVARTPAALLARMEGGSLVCVASTGDLDDAAIGVVLANVLAQKTFVSPTLTFAGAPLLVAGETVGAVAAVDGPARRFTDDDTEALVDLASTYSVKLDLRRALTALGSVSLRFRASVEGMKEAFLLFERTTGDAPTDMVIVETNQVALDLLGPAGTRGPVARVLRDHAMRGPDDAIVELPSTKGKTRSWHLRSLVLDKGTLVLASDVTDERAMQRERLLQAEVLRNMSEGVLIVRATDKVIVYANPKAERIFGYEPGELAGLSVTDIHAGDAEESLRTAARIEALIRMNGEATYDVRNRRKDGREITCRATASTMYSDEHGLVFLAVQGDVTEQRRVEAERDAFFAISPELVAILDASGRFKKLNPAWERTLGWTLEELSDSHWESWVHPDDLAAMTGRPGSGACAVENRYRAKDGSYRVLAWRWGFGVHDYVFATARDVTEQRAAEASVRQSLREKEVLLNEVHHRVKNNLQVVSSLLKLQAEQLDDPRVREALRESQERVRSIALLHELLYRTRDFGRICLTDYADDLARALIRAAAGKSAPRLVVVASDVELSIEQALPCGLILNELLTNALKHAFPTPTPNALVEVSAVRDGRVVCLSVTDNGVGPAEGFDRRATLGLHLVRRLARQLQGTLESRMENGLRWSLTFPNEAT